MSIRSLVSGAFLAVTVRAQVQNSSCAADCQILMPYATVWMWTPDQTWGAFIRTISDVTAIATVITVINTALDVTSTVTSFPSGFIPPETNVEGTRVRTITYTRSSKASVTVVAFPTPFIAWPDEYGWDGTLDVRNGDSTQCSTVTIDSGRPYGPTTRITTNPQPTSGSLFPENVTDPSGLSYDFVPEGIEQTIFASRNGVVELFPDEQAINVCRPGGAGPNLGNFVATRWLTTNHPLRKFSELPIRGFHGTALMVFVYFAGSRTRVVCVLHTVVRKP
ncbi:hypothetical protein JX265_006825 [Neoarthrinium moseri]|uniref:Uncharacterized protein n=1 Tax=Neoarthrinium moseri TaxID=1658444 RepID=A0A9P9WLD3_9PEZI|nr:hypothetical protein JX265_006825 [Neoarthrinium moseri]